MLCARATFNWTRAGCSLNKGLGCRGRLNKGGWEAGAAEAARPPTQPLSAGAPASSHVPVHLPQALALPLPSIHHQSIFRPESIALSDPQLATRYSSHLIVFAVFFLLPSASRLYPVCSIHLKRCPNCLPLKSRPQLGIKAAPRLLLLHASGSACDKVSRDTTPSGVFVTGSCTALHRTGLGLDYRWGRAALHVGRTAAHLIDTLNSLRQHGFRNSLHTFTTSINPNTSCSSTWLLRLLGALFSSQIGQNLCTAHICQNAVARGNRPPTAFFTSHRKEKYQPTTRSHGVSGLIASQETTGSTGLRSSSTCRFLRRELSYGCSRSRSK